MKIAATPKQLPKRFYKDVRFETAAGGYRILLDGKPLRTPAKAELCVPSQPLAEAIAEEWQSQGDRVDPQSMPLTRLSNAALDLVRGREDAVRDEVASYASSDLLCYRAEGPEGLVHLQKLQWDPVLAWASDELGAHFAHVEGVMHVAQPEAALARVRQAVAELDVFGLTALHTLTTLTGSSLLALAHARGRLSAEAAWQAAHVDEDWQISQWGEDAEAMARRARRWEEFEAASRLLALVRQ